jgi:two-component system sensor histidine kinase AtoS
MLNSPESPKNPSGRFRLRLNIAIPCLLVLITGICGQVAKSILENAAASLGEKSGSDAIQQAILQVEIMIWVGVLVSAIAGVFLSRIVTVPFRRIAQHLDTVAREGRAPSLDVSSRDEIGNLYASFNRMVTSLERFLPEQSRYLFHGVATGIFAVNSRGILTNINAAADKTLELGGVGINGQHYKDFFSRFGDMGELTEVIQGSLEAGHIYPGKEIRVSTIAGGKKNLVICTSLSPEPGESGHGVVATVMDLDLLRAVDAQMQHEDKLSSLGRLASGIAHEVRNPLASIRGLAQLLQEGAAKDRKEADNYTKIILEEVDRLNGVVNQLLDFARPSSDERVPASVGELLQKALTLVEPKIRGHHTKLDVDIEENIPLCRVVSDKIMQVFVNLLINAVEAVPDQGTIRVAARRVTEGIQVSVFNSGSFIPPGVLAHLFEPFFTTKEKGTGLGLALSYQIIKSHKGTLVARSTLQEGTTFLCTLPIGENSIRNPNTQEGKVSKITAAPIAV